MHHASPRPETGIQKSSLRLAGTALLALLFSNGLGELPARAATSPTLSVKSSVLVNDGRVDASMLVGNNAEPSFKAALAKIPVGFIAEPLGTITLHRNELTRKLGSFAQLLELPQRVQVLRKGSMLAGEEIGAKVRELCFERLASEPTGEIQIDLSRIPHHVVLPQAPESWNLTPMSSNRLGMRIFQLEAHCGDTVVRHIVQADVIRTIRVAKLRRLAKRGECLSAADLVEEPHRIRNDQPNPPVAIDQVIGKQLANFKSPGTLVRAGDLATACIPEPGKKSDARDLTSTPEPTPEPHHESPALPGETGPETVIRTNPVPRNTPSPRTSSMSQPDAKYLVKNGDRIEFTVKSGNLSLVVPAKALQNGHAGEAIKLLNLQNNRQIKGIITSEGKVEHVAN